MTPVTQSASFTLREEAERYADTLRAQGCVRVRISDNGRGRWFVYWRQMSEKEGDL